MSNATKVAASVKGIESGSMGRKEVLVPMMGFQEASAVKEAILPVDEILALPETTPVVKASDKKRDKFGCFDEVTKCRAREINACLDATPQSTNAIAVTAEVTLKRAVHHLNWLRDRKKKGTPIVEKNADGMWYLPGGNY